MLQGADNSEQARDKTGDIIKLIHYGTSKKTFIKELRSNIKEDLNRYTDIIKYEAFVPAVKVF